MKRRVLLGVLSVAALGVAVGVRLARVAALPADIDDATAPHGGNPDGDVRVVAFFDYNCPFCRSAEPDLQRFVTTDGRIRLVYKDWPVLGPASVAGARLALAAVYQDRYATAHAALMAMKGRRGTVETMREAVQAAGIDMARLDRDAAEHAADITALLARNAAHAAALDLKAVPAFIVGGRRVVGDFDVENFSEFAAKARRAAR